MKQSKKFKIIPISSEVSQISSVLEQMPENCDLKKVNKYRPISHHKASKPNLPVMTPRSGLNPIVHKRTGRIILLNDSRCSLIPKMTHKLTDDDPEQYSMGSNRITLGGTISDNKLMEIDVKLSDYHTVNPRPFLIRKCKNTTNSSASTFELPSEDSYKQVNELINSIKTLIPKLTKDSGNKIRLDTAETDVSEKPTQELDFDLIEKKKERIFIEDNKQNVSIKVPIHEDEEVINDLKELKARINEKEGIALIANINADIKLKMVIPDVIYDA